MFCYSSKCWPVADPLLTRSTFWRQTSKTFIKLLLAESMYVLASQHTLNIFFLWKASFLMMVMKKATGAILPCISARTQMSHYLLQYLSAKQICIQGNIHPMTKLADSNKRGNFLAKQTWHEAVNFQKSPQCRYHVLLTIDWNTSIG